MRDTARLTYVEPALILDVQRITRLRKATRSMSRADWEACYLAHARGEARNLIPFPDISIQQITNSASGEDTARDAIRIVADMLDLARQKRSFDGESRVLDFGCGWGRLTRLLLYEFDPACVFGTDVDDGLVASANALVPGAMHRPMTSMQPLPYATHSFDLVLANSVFSHLSETSHRFHVAEIARILKPDGVAVLSTLDATAVERFFAEDDRRRWIEGILGPEKELHAALKDQGFFWGSTGRWHEYGIAVITELWLRNTWPALGLQPYAHERGSHQRSQALNAATVVTATGTE